MPSLEGRGLPLKAERWLNTFQLYSSDGLTGCVLISEEGSATWSTAGCTSS